MSAAASGLEVSADSWPGMAAVVIVQLAGLAAIWLNQRRGHRAVKTVRDQVQNGHKDRNLRDDIDRVISGVESLHDRVDGLATRVDGIATRVDALGTPRRGW